MVLVLHALAGGGAERVAVRLLQHLDRDRFRPVLALFRAEGPYIEEVPDDVPVVDLKKRTKADWPGTIQRLTRLFRREHPHVILAFDWHANLASLAAARLAGGGIRVVAGVRIHESSYIPLLPRWIQPLRRTTIRTLYPFADVVLTNSEAATGDLAESFKLPRHKLVTIPNPVDIAFVEARAAVDLNGSWFPRDIPVVLAAGRLVPQKCFDVLIDAMAKICKTRECKLVILGEGPDKAALRARADRQGIGESVIIAGFAANPFNLMRHSQVFVLASMAEGLPNVVLEAMACRTPVVATRCSAGAEEILTDGKDGLLVPPGDVDTLAGAIASLLDSPERRATLGAAGYRRVQDFSTAHVIGEFEELFAGLVQPESAEAVPVK